ncbi:MAG: glycosyltransferase family 2 protein [Candidatus Moranbacteria bacterium]|nr:glycosyltransferase family 2 protein [Candidatus Moranbacteria bacterium]
MTKVAIIILNWNKPDLSIDTVNSVLKINRKNFNYQIFLVDNGSSDNSVSIFQKEFSSNPKVKIIRNEANLGFVGGNNNAVKQIIKLDFDKILLLNNDVIVDSEFLQQLIKKSSKYSLLGPKIYFAPGYEYHHNRYSKKERGNVFWFAGGKMDWNNIYGSHIGVDEVDKGQYEQINDKVDFLTGCCLLIDKEVFEKIGFLNEDFFMYLEDADFCQRAKRAGFSLAYIPKSKIWHINSGSSKTGGDLQNYFLTRNRLLFGFRYARLKTKLALIKESIFQLLNPSISKWQKIAIHDFYFKKLGKGSWQ